MAQITIEIPEKLMFALKQKKANVQDIVLKVLEFYIGNISQEIEITKSNTWQLCGSLEITESEPQYILSRFLLLMNIFVRWRV